MSWTASISRPTPTPDSTSSWAIPLRTLSPQRRFFLCPIRFTSRLTVHRETGNACPHWYAKYFRARHFEHPWQKGVIVSNSLKGKRAFVTGGSRGIGAAIVERLAKEGADVAFTFASSPDQANKVADAAKGS